MKTILFAILLLFGTIVRSQHYYNDIKGAQVLCDRMKDYATNKVSTITATGYDGEGVKTREFNEWQQVLANNYAFRVITRNDQQIARRRYQFDANFRLLNITDTSAGIKSTTAYSYDGSNNIISVKTTIVDSLKDFNEITEHKWIYSSSGKPEKMWRVINGKDSIEYRFTVDNKGNVTDERMFRWGSEADLLYYYYDENNRVSDIVRYDKNVGQLLPDAVFEYDENNRVIQKTTILSIVWLNYLIWRFQYNDKGLKVREALFDQKDQYGKYNLRGRIDYAYTFTP